MLWCCLYIYIYIQGQCQGRLLFTLQSQQTISYRNMSLLKHQMTAVVPTITVWQLIRMHSSRDAIVFSTGPPLLKSVCWAATSNTWHKQHESLLDAIVFSTGQPMVQLTQLFGNLPKCTYIFIFILTLLSTSVVLMLWQVFTRLATTFLNINNYNKHIEMSSYMAIYINLCFLKNVPQRNIKIIWLRQRVYQCTTAVEFVL